MISGIGELERGWAVLSTPTIEELQAFDLEQSVPGGPVRIALDRNAVRHLLIPLTAPHPLPASATSNLEVTIRHLRIASTSSAMLDLSCPSAELNREFDAVISDVLEQLSGAADVQAAAIACIARWRSLFRIGRLGALTAEARLGLAAELWVLGALTDEAGESPVTTWAGPDRAVHDFELADRCLEVKGVGPGSQDVVIHGLDQLAPHGGRPLELLLVDVREDDGGPTLDDLVSKVRAVATDPEPFEKLVNRAGWAPGLYLERYVIGQMRMVSMGPGVPALTRTHLIGETLADGVDRVRYRLALDALVPFANPLSTIDLRAMVAS